MIRDRSVIPSQVSRYLASIWSGRKAKLQIVRMTDQDSDDSNSDTGSSASDSEDVSSGQ